LKNIKFMTQDKLDTLFSVIKVSTNPTANRDLAIFTTAYFLGLRASEVGLLIWDDYVPRTKSIMVKRLKNGNWKMIRMPDRFCRYLDTWYKQTKFDLPEDPIFTTRTGSPVSRYTLYALMQLYGTKAKIHKSVRRFHTLRHSIAVHLLDSGADIEDVRDHLGHRRIQNTMIYAKYTSIRQRRFNALVGASKFISG
jgi:site-specific recombinase XerD